MVIDTSAIIAIFQKEPGYEQCISALVSSESVLHISAPTVLEMYFVITSRYGEDAWQEIAEFFDDYGLQFVPIGIDELQHAMDGFRKYGKGRHPAALNFGDCLSYGLAKSLNQPLLFVGDDFSRTDIVSVITN